MDEQEQFLLQNGLEAAITPQNQKLFMNLLNKVAGPAFDGLVKKMENDKYRYMIYFHEKHGLILHKLDMTTTDLEFEEPNEGDIQILKKEELSDIPALIKKLIA